MSAFDFENTPDFSSDDEAWRGTPAGDTLPAGQDDSCVHTFLAFDSCGVARRVTARVVDLLLSTDLPGAGSDAVGVITLERISVRAQDGRVLDALPEGARLRFDLARTRNAAVRLADARPPRHVGTTPASRREIEALCGDSPAFLVESRQPLCGTCPYQTYGAKFCAHCGTRAHLFGATRSSDAAVRSCLACSTCGPADAVYCGNCGTGTRAWEAVAAGLAGRVVVLDARCGDDLRPVAIRGRVSSIRVVGTAAVPHVLLDLVDVLADDIPVGGAPFSFGLLPAHQSLLAPLWSVADGEPVQVIEVAVRGCACGITTRNRYCEGCGRRTGVDHGIGYRAAQAALAGQLAASGRSTPISPLHLPCEQVAQSTDRFCGACGLPQRLTPRPAEHVPVALAELTQDMSF
jgi:hypothetical protein